MMLTDSPLGVVAEAVVDADAVGADVDVAGAVDEAVVDEVGAVVEVACAVVTDPVDVDDTAGLEEEVSSKEKSDIFQQPRYSRKGKKEEGRREGRKQT